MFLFLCGIQIGKPYDTLHLKSINKIFYHFSRWILFILAGELVTPWKALEFHLASLHTMEMTNKSF